MSHEVLDSPSRPCECGVQHILPVGGTHHNNTYTEAPPPHIVSPTCRCGGVVGLKGTTQALFSMYHLNPALGWDRSKESLCVISQRSSCLGNYLPRFLTLCFCCKSIQLCKQLIDCVISLIIAPLAARPPGATDSIKFVDEDDARGQLASLHSMSR